MVGHRGGKQPPHGRMLVGWAVLPDPENGWAGGLQPIAEHITTAVPVPAGAPVLLLAKNEPLQFATTASRS
jgi:hypothetical protein